MARQMMTAQRKGSGGGQVAFVAAHTDGQAVALSRAIRILIQNTSGVSSTVTFITPATADSGALPDKAVAIPAGQTFEFDSFPPAEYQQSDGTIWFGCAPQAGVNIAVLT